MENSYIITTWEGKAYTLKIDALTSIGEECSQEITLKEYMEITRSLCYRAMECGFVYSTIKDFYREREEKTCNGCKLEEVFTEKKFVLEERETRFLFCLVGEIEDWKRRMEAYCRENFK